MATVTKTAEKLHSTMHIIGFGDKNQPVKCEETTLIHFDFTDDKPNLYLQHTATIYHNSSGFPATSRTDFSITPDDNYIQFNNPLTLKELAETILTGKQKTFGLIASHCKQNKIDFPDCFSNSIDSLISDLKNGKVLQTPLEKLPDDCKV